MAVVDVFRDCGLFKGFTDTGLQILAGIASERQFPKGAPLFVENMVGESLFILAQGRVRLTTKVKGEEVALGELGAGDWLGELALLQESQRMCTATALSPVTAVELRHADFQKLMGQKPQACMKLLMGIVTQFGRKVSENRSSFQSLIPAGSASRKG